LEICFVIENWIKIPNVSLYLGIEHDSFVVLNRYGKNKSFLYNWSKNWWL